MDAHDLFRRLGVGAKFDVKRFSADAARFQVLYVEVRSPSNCEAQEPENDLVAGRAGTGRPWPSRGTCSSAVGLVRRPTWSCPAFGVNSYPCFVDFGGPSTEILLPARFLVYSKHS